MIKVVRHLNHLLHLLLLSPALHLIQLGLVSGSPLSDCLGADHSQYLTEQGDAEYEFLATGWVAIVARRPSGILQIQNEEDIVVAINCAKEVGIAGVVGRSGKSACLFYQ